MPEPEGVIIDAAHQATTAVARLWRRHQPSGEVLAADQLDYHRERLRWLVAAAFGGDCRIRVAQPPAPPTLLQHLFAPLPQRLRVREALPATDGVSLFLPACLSADGDLDSERWYRVLALQQAARARGMRPSAPLHGLAADLYTMATAAAAERALARELPGMTADLARARAAVLRRRPPLHLLTPAERGVEQRYRALLAEPDSGPADALDWAYGEAAAIAREPGRYRGLPRDLWWGKTYPPPAPLLAEGDAFAGNEESRPRTGRMPRRPEPRAAEPDEDAGPEGPWMLQTDDPLQHVEDGGGAKRPLDAEEGDPADLADSLSELPQARTVSTPEPAREVLVSDDAPDRGALAASRYTAAGAAIQYPEWDYRTGRYRRPGATVHLCSAADGDLRWADGVLKRRAALMHGVKRRFERLRPRRESLGRQPDGEEVDMDAYVNAFADMQAGAVPDQRLYRRARPARRELAITLLVDISGSTDAWVNGDLRIIDVEKEALLIVCHALDALGDPYAIQAFSGEGPERVRVWPLKRFDEKNRAAVQRRIAALGPERFTRVGAALRHATAGLAARHERHRLLLLLSDGKPNDLDEYEGRYGVEDLSRAVTEATLQGLHCFCLTVDRHAPGYLHQVFGPGRYAVLRHPADLPVVLVEVLRQLLRD